MTAFSSKAIAGDHFNIICPGTFSSVAKTEIGKTLFFRPLPSHHTVEWMSLIFSKI